MFQKGLKIIDDTVGKDVKLIDQVTDLFQDEQIQLYEDLNERVTRIEKLLEEILNENKDAG